MTEFPSPRYLDDTTWDIATMPNWGRAWAPEVAADALDRVDFFASYVAKWRPLVVRGLCRHWPAIERWREDNYLWDRWGDLEVPADVASHAVRKDRVKMKLREALREDAPAQYRVASLILSEVGPVVSEIADNSMATDFGSDRLIDDTPLPVMYPRQRLFLYRAGITHWHYHPADETITYQLLGKKRFALVDSRQTKAIVRAASDNLLPAKEGTDRYPEYANVMPLCAELDPGDAIYIPPLSWHAVQPPSRGLGATLAVTWKSRPLAFYRTSPVTNLAMMLRVSSRSRQRRRAGAGS